MKVYLIVPRWERPVFNAVFTTEEVAKKVIEGYAEWYKVQKRPIREHSPDPNYLDILEYELVENAESLNFDKWWRNE